MKVQEIVYDPATRLTTLAWSCHCCDRQDVEEYQCEESVSHPVTRPVAVWFEPFSLTSMIARAHELTEWLPAVALIN